MALYLERSKPSEAMPTTPAPEDFELQLRRLQNASDQLSQALTAAGDDQRVTALRTLLAAYETSITPTAGSPSLPAAANPAPGKALTDWTERLLKIRSTERGALHDEVAELLTYSVQSAETERATQDIAIEALKLVKPHRRGFDSRDTNAISAIHDESQKLSETMTSMPISPSSSRR